jgi:membrane protein implicated in regulation of membrane protease activity
VLLAASIAGLFILPGPWNVLLFAAAVVIEIGELYLWKKFLDRYRVRGGAEGMVGEKAVVLETCDPLGTVRVRGEIWSATAQGATVIAAGEKARVLAVDGLRVTIEPA